ncbi:MAG TPA: GDSL-type esterase/lipase family protein [Halomicronema sp.]
MQILVNSVSQSLQKPKRQPLKVIALGDSLVYGYGDPEGGGWVERLRRCWMYSGDTGPVLYNLGVRGDRVRQVANRLEMEFRHRGELRNSLPDVLILSVGVNDSARIARPNGRNYTELGSFQEDIAALLDIAKSLCPVYFVGMVPVDEEKMPFLDSFYYSLAEQFRYKEATKQACLSRQIPYLDIFDLWMARGENWRQSRLCDDGLHPNVAGYQFLLQDVFSWEPISSLAKVPDTNRPFIG